MSFSCRFLQIKEVNQKFPQMTLIQLKTWHFHTKKNIWCWYKIANISRLWCCRMSNLTIYHFTSNNFNYSLFISGAVFYKNLFELSIYPFNKIHTHARTHAHTHTHTHTLSRTRAHTHTHARARAHSLAHSLTPSLTHSLPCSLAHSLTHSLTYAIVNKRY